MLFYGVFLFTDKRFVSDNLEKRLSVKDFNLIKVIGRGAFGEVQVVCMITTCVH